jgi:hypothetical protein
MPAHLLADLLSHRLARLQPHLLARLQPHLLAHLLSYLLWPIGPAAVAHALVRAAFTLV